MTEGDKLFAFSAIYISYDEVRMSVTEKLEKLKVALTSNVLCTFIFPGGLLGDSLALSRKVMTGLPRDLLGIVIQEMIAAPWQRCVLYCVHSFSF